MAEWRPFEDWKRNLSEVLSLSSAAAASLGLPQPGMLVGDPFAVIVDAARNWLIGKKRTFTFAGRDLTLVLEDLSVEGSDLAKAVGQYGQVRILARDVVWDGYQLERLEIQARNGTYGPLRSRYWWPRRSASRPSSRPRPRPGGWSSCRRGWSWPCTPASRRSA